MSSIDSGERHFTRQLVIVHLSDLHFGSHHRFNPQPTTGGDIPVREGYPSLLEKLSEDLQHRDPRCPVIICVTGDLVETGSPKEFGEAELFINGLTTKNVFGSTRQLNTIFLVQGNHDVAFGEPAARERLAGYAQLLSKLSGVFIDASDPWGWPLVHDRADDLGAIVVTLNSSIYVQKGKDDETRGHVDVRQLSSLEQQLQAISNDRLTRAVKIALIHHHPVLIPSLAEPGRGYDAVHNSGKLLAILRKRGFHMVLHGHKHDPCVFTEDSRSPYRISTQNPILIAAGGSLGSTQLPQNRGNCYNRISIKWHPAAGQARILIETVGLSVFDEDGNEALPANWSWKVLRKDDIHFLEGRCVPTPTACVKAVEREPDQLRHEDQRKTEYERLRGNMLSVDVRPSLKPDQGYEAIVWITPHPRSGEAKPPVRIEWSAGPKFRAVVPVTHEDDAQFCARFDYWGPMLIQAKLFFSDGAMEHDFIYARIPEDCSRNEA